MTAVSSGILVGITSTLLLVFVYAFLFISERRGYLMVWTAAWVAYLLRFAVELITAAGDSSAVLPFFSHTLILVSGTLLLGGAYRMTGRIFPRGWIYLAAAVFVYAIVIGARKDVASIYSFPVFYFVGAATVWTGVLFWRSAAKTVRSAYAVGAVFIIWGIHKLDYPFLRSTELGATVGYMAAGFLAAVAAVTTVIYYFEENRHLLHERNSHFQSLFQHNNSVMLLADLERGVVVEANATACRYYGRSNDEMEGMSLADIDVAYGDGEQGLELAAALLENRITAFHSRHLVADGTIRDVEIFATPLSIQDRRLVHAIVIDVSERERLENAVRESESRFREVVENIRELLWVEDRAKRKILYVSPTFRSYFGDSAARLGQGSSEWLGWVHHDDRAKLLREARVYFETGTVDFEIRARLQDGTYRWMAVHTSPVEGTSRVVGIAEDATDRVLNQQMTLRSLQEKEVLLREIHHRVKNNLQIISSLLALQARTMVTPEGRRALEETQERIRAIALTHKILYESKHLDRIDLNAYLSALIHSLGQSLAFPLESLSMTFPDPPLEVDISEAIPCGLIVSELVTNSIRHGFVAHGSEAVTATPKVSVSLQLFDDNAVRLRVNDNGVGMPPETELGSEQTLGLLLVRTLTRQLRGTARFVRSTDGDPAAGDPARGDLAGENPGDKDLAGENPARDSRNGESRRESDVPDDLMANGRGAAARTGTTSGTTAEILFSLERPGADSPGTQPEPSARTVIRSSEPTPDAGAASTGSDQARRGNSA